MRTRSRRSGQAIIPRFAQEWEKRGKFFLCHRAASPGEVALPQAVRLRSSRAAKNNAVIRFLIFAPPQCFFVCGKQSSLALLLIACVVPFVYPFVVLSCRKYDDGVNVKLCGADRMLLEAEKQEDFSEPQGE